MIRVSETDEFKARLWKVMLLFDSVILGPVAVAETGKMVKGAVEPATAASETNRKPSETSPAKVGEKVSDAE